MLSSSLNNCDCQRLCEQYTWLVGLLGGIYCKFHKQCILFCHLINVEYELANFQDQDWKLYEILHKLTLLNF